MNKLAIIGVPSSAGARRNGQERAAQSFRGADFIDQLQPAGLEVIDSATCLKFHFNPMNNILKLRISGLLPT